MRYYTLSNVPNQSFNTNLNGHNFAFQFHSYRGLTYIDVLVDGTLKQSGSVATPNTSIFKTEVNNLAGGEFLFVCSSDDYPYYESFDNINERFAFRPFGE